MPRIGFINRDIFGHDKTRVSCSECSWTFQGSSAQRAKTALRRHRTHCKGTKLDRRRKLDRKKFPTVWERLRRDEDR